MILLFSVMRMSIHLRELKILLNTALLFKPSHWRAVENIVIFWSDFLEKSWYLRLFNCFVESISLLKSQCPTKVGI